MKIKLFILLFVLSFEIIFGQTNYYVSTSGSDSNPGTITQPWKTIQHAANTVSAGDYVYVRGGQYNERVTINVSGSSGNFITFQNYENENPIIDGTGLTVPPSDNGLFFIDNKSYIIIKGFELRNYETSQKDIVPAGVYITGTSNNIEIRNCVIHNIKHTAPLTNGSDAHGIAVYGTSAVSSINNITIDGNELYDLVLGSSEALVLNGNVEQFTVSNNTVHDINNIAIDCIGFEGTALSNDQARNGNIIDNLVYNVTSINNPAYRNSYGADGIYIDGGTNIIIDRNIVHNADVGIELASEHKGKATSYVTVRNNLVYENNIAGISMGGYDTLRGSTENCTVVNNTLYNNDTQHEYNGELWFQYDVRNSVVKNNIFYANSQAVLISNYYTENTNNTVDYNLYYSPTGANNSTWVWKNNEYFEFSTYRNNTGNDLHGLFSNPMFVDVNNNDFHLQSNSPAINIGDNSVDAGNYDLDKMNRIENTTIDLGSYEYRNIVLLQTKIFLEGPYNSTSHQMDANLGSNVPKTSPYSEDPRTVNSIPADVVDWVLVQLRTTANGTAVTSHSAFINKDGRIVADDGTTGEIKLNTAEGNYYIVIKHRNHLAIMSANAVALNSTTSTLYDFTTGSDKYYGTGGSKQLE